MKFVVSSIIFKARKSLWTLIIKRVGWIERKVKKNYFSKENIKIHLLAMWKTFSLHVYIQIYICNMYVIHEYYAFYYKDKILQISL